MGKNPLCSNTKKYFSASLAGLVLVPLFNFKNIEMIQWDENNSFSPMQPREGNTKACEGSL